MLEPDTAQFYLTEREFDYTLIALVGKIFENLRMRNVSV